MFAAAALTLLREQLPRSGRSRRLGYHQEDEGGAGDPVSEGGDDLAEYLAWSGFGSLALSLVLACHVYGFTRSVMLGPVFQQVVSVFFFGMSPVQ